MKKLYHKYGGLFFVSILFGTYFWALPLQTQDGPNHKKVAVILERLPESPAENSIYQSNLGPFQTNILFPLGYQCSSGFLSIQDYEKIFFGFFLLLIPWAYRYFLSVWSPQSTGLWLLVLPLWFHPLFIRGMYNYTASVPLTLLALSWMWKGLQTRQWKYFLPFGLICYVLFLAHPFPFFILSLSWILMCLPDFKMSFLRRLPFGLVVFLFLFLGFLFPLFRPAPESVLLPPYLFKPLWELAGGLLVYNFVGYSVKTLLLSLPLLILLLGLMVFSLLSVPWKQKIFWISFTIAYLLFPDEGHGGAHLGQRFLPFIWLFLPLGITLNLPWRKIVQSVSLMTTFLLGAVVFNGMQNISQIAVSAQRVLAPLPTGSRLYPINFSPHGPALNYSSLLHLWANFDDSQVIFSPYLFANLDLMPLYRKRPATPEYFPANSESLAESIATQKICRSQEWIQTVDCKLVRTRAFEDILQNAAYYDYWFLQEPPRDFEIWIQSIPGVQKLKEESGLSLWHYTEAKGFNPPLP